MILVSIIEEYPVYERFDIIENIFVWYDPKNSDFVLKNILDDDELLRFSITKDGMLDLKHGNIYRIDCKNFTLSDIALSALDKMDE